MIEHECEIFPLIIEVEANDQIESLRKVADRIEELGCQFGTFLEIHLVT